MKTGLYDNEKTMEAKRQIRRMACETMGVEYNEKTDYQCLMTLGRGKMLAMYIQGCSTGGSYNNDPVMPSNKVYWAVEKLVTEKLEKGAPQLSAADVQTIIARYKDIVFKAFWTGKAFETPYGTGRAFVVDFSLNSLLRSLK